MFRRRGRGTRHRSSPVVRSPRSRHRSSSFEDRQLPSLRATDVRICENDASITAFYRNRGGTILCRLGWPKRISHQEAIGVILFHTSDLSVCHCHRNWATYIRLLLERNLIFRTAVVVKSRGVCPYCAFAAPRIPYSLGVSRKAAHLHFVIFQLQRAPNGTTLKLRPRETGDHKALLK